MLDPIWMPCNPISLHRSNSWMLNSVSCMGKVPSPT